MSDKKFFAIATSAILLLGVISVWNSPLLNYAPNESNIADAQEDGPGPTGVHREYTLVAEEVELEIAPGERVKTWTYNGTVPGPTLRFTEGDNVTIHFVNKTPLAHTVHFHGNHDDKSDGVLPQVLPGQSYTYNFIADPAGALMYHCHAYPTSLHIRMGMYGAMIIDPKDTSVLKPAREYAIVLSEFDPENQDNFVAKYYPVNGYTDQYMSENALKAYQNELVRLYVINMGTTIPYSFHLHSTIFKVYQSGLVSNAPIDAQTIEIGPGNAAIVEAKWKWPGMYLFHSHGIQEERGNMGEIHVVASEDNKGATAGSDSGDGLAYRVTDKNISMIDWQYQLQKQLQKPSEANSTTPEVSVPQEHNHQSDSDTVVKMLKGAWDKNQKDSYAPAKITVGEGTEVTWVNEDSIVHTVTSDEDGAFDSSIVAEGQQWQHTFDEEGVYDYHCTVHPWMTGTVTVN